MKIHHEVQKVDNGFRYTRKEGCKIVFREVYDTNDIMCARIQGEFDYQTRNLSLEEKKIRLLEVMEALGVKTEDSLEEVE